MNVICISGKAGAGKDTAAGFLKSYLERNGKRVLITHYADLVKYVCSNFHGWSGKKDEAGRSLLQYVGTDCVRHDKPNYWVDFIIEQLRYCQDRWDFVLIPDTRFPNEYTGMVDAGYPTTLIRIERPGFASVLTEEQKAHPSETAMNGAAFDMIVYNDGNLLKLYSAMAEMAESRFGVKDNKGGNV